jgi:hypothetical protein
VLFLNGKKGKTLDTGVSVWSDRSKRHELLDETNYIEHVGNWTADGAILTNPSTGILRVQKDGNGMAYQEVAGESLTISGRVRGDGSAAPYITEYGVGILWSGSASPSWQDFNITIAASSLPANIAVRAFGGASDSYVEADSLHIIEAQVDLEQATGGYQPTDNNDRITFDGSDDFLAAEDATKPLTRCLHDGTGATALIVFDAVAVSTSNNQIILGGGNGSNTGFRVYLDASTPALYVRVFDGPNTEIVAEASLTVTTARKYLAAIQFDSSELTLELWDELGNYSSDTDSSIGTPDTGDAGHTFALGAFYDGSQPFGGSVYDVVAYREVLAAKLATVVQSLRVKNGL